MGELALPNQLYRINSRREEGWPIRKAFGKEVLFGLLQRVARDVGRDVSLIGGGQTTTDNFGCTHVFRHDRVLLTLSPPHLQCRENGVCQAIQTATMIWLSNT